MSKRVILILVIFLLSFSFARANVIITEIMYDYHGSEGLGEHDWVEIKNIGLSSVNLIEQPGEYSRWRFSKGTSNYQLFSFNSSSNVLSGDYAIISSEPEIFLQDYPEFSGLVFDSSNFALTSTGTLIGVKDTSGEFLFSPFTYIPMSEAEDSGNSLQLVNDSWIVASPTPGVANQSVSVSSTGGETSTSSSISNTTETKITEIQKIKTKIDVKTDAFIGIPIEFKTSTTGYFGETLYYGKYFWNFGDGDSKEMKVNDSSKLTHTFFYEGEYSVVLEYYSNYYSSESDASDRIIIKVVPADIVISKVGDEKDFFVEITNNTNYNADISGWFLMSDKSKFIFPQNTILNSKKKMILSPKVTNLSFSDKDTLKLMDKEWETVFDHSSLVKPAKTLLNNITSTKNSTATSTAVKPPLGGFTAKLENEQVSVDDLGATAVKNGSNTENNMMYVIGFFALLGLSAGATYFIRARNRGTLQEKTGDDFEIIDE